ncbi:restriction endonuclease subunit S [Curtobacterium flaccumfaciens]|uniref:restriction endonuclease subunit S n=1 Tax=Curtobacterium flaccumfaciens TaxID=2035 RepID=UPI0021C643B6|nr:restriction endonuclease subunit S [Curtobacterium flaccumfaciens]UXN21166.1 restriction endonuclease subunit S [Curtobacterium flaccumfaciens pv. flaccumfaciens]
MPTVSAGPVMVTAKDIRGGRIDYKSARFTSREAYDTLLTDKSRPRVGDVLLTKDGSIGRVAVCDRPDICINQSVALLQLNELADPKFLAYMLQAPDYQQRMAADADGSTIKHIYITRVDKMEVLLPPKREQEAIAEVLQSFDLKVASNERAIQLADDLSRARFQAAAASGIEVPLSSLSKFVNGRAYTKDATGSGRVVVRIAELNSGIGASTVWNNIEVPDDNTARPGDLLFAWSGSLTAARWYRPEAIVNQHIFKVVPNKGVPKWLVNQAVHATLDEFKAIAADKATTMGHIQRHHLDEPVKVPTPAATKKLDGLMTGLWDAALAAEIENLKLIEIRDELLPLLMSGRLRVKDVERTVEGVR